MDTAHLATGVLAAVSALGVPPGATSTCSFDSAGATLNVQMLAARVVIRAGGDRILVDGHDCDPGDVVIGFERKEQP